MSVVERVGISSAFSLSFRPGQLMTVGCGVAVSSPQILSFPLPASLKKGGIVMAVSPWYLVAWKTLFNVSNNFQEKDLCFLSLSNVNFHVSSFCRLDPSEFGCGNGQVERLRPLCQIGFDPVRNYLAR